MKILELIIDAFDELTGVDAVALVEKPAIEAEFMAFKEVGIEESIAFNLIKQMIFDETGDPQEIVIGDYQTRHYDMCPGASALYTRIENNEIDTDMGLAIRNAKLQDALFYLEKHTLHQMGSASFDDVKTAEIIAGEIMTLARMMGLEEEHQYILGHLQAIRELYQKGQEGQLDVDVSALPPYNNETKEELSSDKFSFSLNEDQQIVVGPLMIPNKLIYRVDEQGDPYFVFFSEDTIQKVSDKLMRENHMHTLNVEHNPEDTVNGYMMETWLVEDPINDKQQVYGFNYPKGSWLGKYKIEDMEVWQKVKNREINGFSIEGFFSDRFVQAQAQTK